MKLYKYQGAGNDFLLIDGRDGSVHVDADVISSLCDRRYGIGADGLMVLGPAAEGYDFRMEYYNSDGSGGMMCGNGGRCIVSFAQDVAYPGKKTFSFIAPDGPHTGEVLLEEGKSKIVRISIKNVDTIESLPEHEYFLDTGTRHFVRFVGNLAGYDVVTEGRTARHDPRFAPVGVNANFVEIAPDGTAISVRTFEKGVEDETYACGTGITASAIATYVETGLGKKSGDGRISFDVHALKDELAVDFVPGCGVMKDVHLTGPATYVAAIEV